ncbi:MAG: MFS transporter [Actinomycetota bacterium]
MAKGPDKRSATAIRRALARPHFRRLFVAQTVSRWGDTFSAVALVIAVYNLTGSGVQVSAVVAVEIAPVLLFGFLAGSVVDRLPRRRVMVAADLGRATIAALLALAPDHLWAIYTAAFGLSALTVFFNPAAASVVPNLVQEDELVGANSALWSAAVLSQIVLAPVAGAVVAWAGAATAFAINAISFLVSAAALARLAVPPSAPIHHQGRWAQAVEGVSVIRRSRFLATLAAVQGLAALSAGATSALLVVLAQRHLDVDARGFGLLLAAIGVGAGAGPLALQRFVTDVRRPVLLFGPYLLRGVVDLVLATFSSFAVALGALAAYGVGTSTGNVTYNTALQTTTPDRLRGRVFAFYDVVWQTARLASIGIGGVLADQLGIRGVYIMGGALLIAAGAIGYARVPPAAMMSSAVADDG